MAKKGGNPQNLRPPFPKGVSGNPAGGPKLPEDIVKARRMNQVELERIINKYLYLDKDELKASISRPGTPMMELMVASIVAQAAQKGDQMRLDFILTRLIGKGPIAAPQDPIRIELSAMPREQLIARMEYDLMRLKQQQPQLLEDTTIHVASSSTPRDE